MRWTAARPPAPLQACCRWLRLVRDCLESTETAVLDVPRQHELQERWVAVSRGCAARRQLTPRRRRHAALYSNLIVATATIGLCYAAHSGFMVCWDIYLTGIFFAMKLHINWYEFDIFFSVLHLSYLWVFLLCTSKRCYSCLRARESSHFSIFLAKVQ